MSGKVITALIKKISPHANAKKLRICTVCNGKENLQIVCGASNAYEGMLTILAEVGSELPDGKKIEKASLRGVDSWGMLCSPKELGLAQEDGIIDLPSNLFHAGISFQDISAEYLSSTPWYSYSEKETFWESKSTKEIIITRNPSDHPGEDYHRLSKTYWHDGNYLYRNF